MVSTAQRLSRKGHHLILCQRLQRIAVPDSSVLKQLDHHLYVRQPLQVRYNAVRRQTAAKAGEKEFQVLDYQNTSADLLPLVASSYALIFMVRRPSTVCAACWNDGLWMQPRSGCRSNFSWQGASAGLHVWSYLWCWLWNLDRHLHCWAAMQLLVPMKAGQALVF